MGVGVGVGVGVVGWRGNWSGLVEGAGILLCTPLAGCDTQIGWIPAVVMLPRFSRVQLLVSRSDVGRLRVTRLLEDD